MNEGDNNNNNNNIETKNDQNHSKSMVFRTQLKREYIGSFEYFRNEFDGYDAAPDSLLFVTLLV